MYLFFDYELIYYIGIIMTQSKHNLDNINELNLNKTKYQFFK